MIKVKKLEKEIKKLKQEKQKSLNKLYDLGLAPFYGYYEMKLKATQLPKKP